jgi:phosphatidylglycerol---prolipoprotein diacylglyceryl transferase
VARQGKKPLILSYVTALPKIGPLGLRPSIPIGPFELRWYSLSYLAGIVMAWWYVLKLLAQPGAPMARRHADDLVFYATLGVIIGGRIAYVLFYDPSILDNPLGIFMLWKGGMSFHGGVLGVTAAILYLSWKNKLNWLRVHDYVACGAPFGLFFGRLANFVNGELWGSPTKLPWGVVFPADPQQLPRHPSQIYEAGLEGVGLFILLWFLFWKTQARYQPGKLVGAFLLGYGVSRFLIEFVREPDSQLVEFAMSSGLHMGQWLSLPMIFGGLYLVLTAKARRQRVEPIAGSESIA